ncbi:MAG: hypothetical protein OXT09_02045 [Myxococcales bacterium]|nr:hypothetical protein [Myxococcales bacterium]
MTTASPLAIDAAARCGEVAIGYTKCNTREEGDNVVLTPDPRLAIEGDRLLVIADP